MNHISLEHPLTKVPFFSLRRTTGRGGSANVTLEVSCAEGPVDPHGADHPRATHTHEYEYAGRGGSENISRDRSRERAEPCNGRGH